LVSSSAAAQTTLTVALTAATGGEDGRIVIQVGHDGAVTLVASGATRRELLKRLFADDEIRIQWRNPAFADQPIDGRYNGSADEIARRLLNNGDYIMAYREQQGRPRIAHIIIFDLGAPPPKVSAKVRPVASSAARPMPTSEAERRWQAEAVVRRLQTIPPFAR
jgi:hypothetical protein